MDLMYFINKIPPRSPRFINILLGSISFGVDSLCGISVEFQAHSFFSQLHLQNPSRQAGNVMLQQIGKISKDRNVATENSNLFMVSE